VAGVLSPRTCDRWRKCRGCSATFRWSREDQEHAADRGVRRLPRKCPACRAQGPGGEEGWLRNVGTTETGGKTRVCFDCRNAFELEAGEIDWYSRHGLTTPRRCKGCRQRRRTQWAQAAVNDAETERPDL
jgi:hypothetical protein